MTKTCDHDYERIDIISYDAGDHIKKILSECDKILTCSHESEVLSGHYYYETFCLQLKSGRKFDLQLSVSDMRRPENKVCLKCEELFDGHKDYAEEVCKRVVNKIEREEIVRDILHRKGIF